LRKIVFHDEGLFQTSVCNGEIFGIYEEFLSVAVAYIISFMQVNLTVGENILLDRRNPEAMHKLMW
jgi:hypothetical protein